MPKIVLSGGNEFQKPDGLDEYVAAESNGLMDLLPYASEDAGAGPTLLANQRYEPLGVSIRPHGSEDLLSPPTIPARVAYLSGGNQDILKDTLNDSALWHRLVATFMANEVILVGSSAGAMVLFEQMISHSSERASSPQLVPGLSLIKGAKIFVPHWDTYEASWQTNFVDTYDKYLVIGVAENTAVVWEYGQAQVMGLGSVIIYDELVRSQYKSGDTFKFELNFNDGS